MWECGLVHSGSQPFDYYKEAVNDHKFLYCHCNTHPNSELQSRATVTQILQTILIFQIMVFILKLESLN